MKISGTFCGREEEKEGRGEEEEECNCFVGCIGENVCIGLRCPKCPENIFEEDSEVPVETEQQEQASEFGYSNQSLLVLIDFSGFPGPGR